MSKFLVFFLNFICLDVYVYLYETVCIFNLNCIYPVYISCDGCDSFPLMYIIKNTMNVYFITYPQIESSGLCLR